MNERIQELAEQSRETVSSTEFAGETWTQFDEGKFAQLIVRECAIAVQDFVDHRIPASEYPARLKKYFGVE